MDGEIDVYPFITNCSLDIISGMSTIVTVLIVLLMETAMQTKVLIHAKVFLRPSLSQFYFNHLNQTDQLFRHFISLESLKL